MGVETLDVQLIHKHEFCVNRQILIKILIWLYCAQTDQIFTKVSLLKSAHISHSTRSEIFKRLTYKVAKR